MGVSPVASILAILADPLRFDSVESTFPGWLDQLMASIDPLFPPEAGFTSHALDTVPPPRIRLEKVGSTSAANGHTEQAPLLWTEDASWAKLVRNERVTAEDWYQDVREVELELEGVQDSERTRLYVPSLTYRLDTANA